jgi:hypothetical protein
MVDPVGARISCGCSDEIVQAINTVVRGLAPDVRRRFNTIALQYLARYGVDGLYQRLNNRTVADILADYNPADDVKPIASGDVDGVRYMLYEAPPTDSRSERTDEVEDA